MAKFYVQCGPVRVILIAEGIRHAALTAIDRVLSPHSWIYDDPDLSEDDRRTHLMLEALLQLDPVIRVSERGFDRRDAREVGTPETVERWHGLITGMNRLFVAAGLPPRRMTELHCLSDVADR